MDLIVDSVEWAILNVDRGAEEIHKIMQRLQERFSVLNALHDEVRKVIENAKTLQQD
jgi:hypothetical protein